MPDLPWPVYAFPFAFIAIIAGAAIYKWLQVRQAAHWPSTPGKVVVSASQVRKVLTFDDDTAGGKREEERNFANIVYEYTVSGQKLRNNRVSIGEDLGNFEVAETIARYPVGLAVTVYYNPRKPRDAVLERDAPKGVFGCVIWLVVLGTVGILGTFFGFNQLSIYLTERVHNTPMTIGLSAMGLVTVLFGFAFFKQARAARSWPQVTGRITKSEVDEFRGQLDHDSQRRTLYRPEISYHYEYNGISYTGTQVSLGVKMTSSNSGFAKRMVEKYPRGKTFKIYVNPQNPSESLLSAGGGAAWFIWAMALVLFAGAYFVATH